jgi:hypothetical protein
MSQCVIFRKGLLLAPKWIHPKGRHDVQFVYEMEI